MTSSAFRRNVAEHLGISTAALIKNYEYQPDPEEVAAVRTSIEECEVAWLETKTASEALELEGRMRSEWLPPLNRA